MNIVKFISLFILFAAMGCQVPIQNFTGLKLIVDGNSLTQSRNGVESMPSIVVRQLSKELMLDMQSESGIGMVEMMLTAHLARIYNAYQSGSILLVWEINHDISTGGFTADQAVNRLWHYCDIQRSRGYKVVTLTTLPAYGGVYIQPDFENKRLAVNARMRAEWSSHVDALIDVGADPNMGRPEACTEGIYYDPVDTVHLTTAGANLVATYVIPVIEELIK